MKYKLLSALALFIFCFTSAFSQEADNVIKKYLTASGQEKVKEVKTMSMDLIVNAQGMQMPMKTIVKKPNSFYMEMNMQGQKMKIGFDGTKGWMLNPMMGNTAREMPAEQIKQFNKQSNFEQMDFLKDYKKQGFTATYLGKEAVNDKPAHKIKMTKKDTTDQTYFFDVNSNLLVKQTTKTKVGDKEVETETYLKDYKMVDGLNIPHSIVVNIEGMGEASTVTLSNVQLNKPVDEALFKMPAN
ncbi:MAG TPA: outer membrane lipoprotein-sorting protein [Cytophagales bacterium]|nr:outer membrane lipoprotein-sorting protein [Cytophagales bacterium]